MKGSLLGRRLPPRALGIVKEFFPTVTKMVDAVRPLWVEVTPRDVKVAAQQSHRVCALAVACKRAQHASGMVVSVRAIYVVQGHRATRYEAPDSVAREIVAFDRGAPFKPGFYRLRPPVHKLGERSTWAKRNKRKPSQRRHYTTGIRTVLGGPKQ